MHCKAQDEKLICVPNRDEIAEVEVASEALAHAVVAATAKKSPAKFGEESIQYASAVAIQSL
ncbi:hypothetical protein TRAPUB_8950 [Trametes pubescens]|uniref:Uncharacterized protein n=1 Tax=Trametes pubescens TaxID=154538 RepID=A0A1M2W3R9_TRAPU|nr:hypothetical protein TRAPUB_8950 [Trametes pubescens]